MAHMASSNPALRDDIFQQETQASRGGTFSPGWGSPADEVPPGLFAPPGSAGTTTGYGPPPTGYGPQGTAYGPPPTGTPVGPRGTVPRSDSVYAVPATSR